MQSGSLTGHALYLDIDGTLLDIAPSPEAVEVPPELIPLLQRLWLQLDGAVAFVSGRTIAAIDRLFDPLRLPAIGVHGGEIRTVSRTSRLDEGLAEQLQRVEAGLRAALAAVPGAWLENKRSAIALHYRNSPQRGGQVLKVAEIALAGLGSEFSLVVGKCVVELRPRQCTKASAMLELMAEAPFSGRTPIVAGDDTSDEDAFELVNRLGGLSVCVGAPGAPTAATCRLPDPAALRDWLLEIAAA
jgi:trehalose 6-phosphate phosphatase